MFYYLCLWLWITPLPWLCLSSEYMALFMPPLPFDESLSSSADMTLTLSWISRGSVGSIYPTLSFCIFSSSFSCFFAARTWDISQYMQYRMTRLSYQLWGYWSKRLNITAGGLGNFHPRKILSSSDILLYSVRILLSVPRESNRHQPLRTVRCRRGKVKAQYFVWWAASMKLSAWTCEADCRRMRPSHHLWVCWSKVRFLLQANPVPVYAGIDVSTNRVWSCFLSRLDFKLNFRKVLGRESALVISTTLILLIPNYRQSRCQIETIAG